MIRLACLIILVALGAVTVLAVDPSGPTAIVFVFIGMPALVVGLLLYGAMRLRAGAFRNGTWPRKEPS